MADYRTCNRRNENISIFHIAEGKIASYEAQQTDPALTRANLLVGQWTFHETIINSFTDIIKMTTIRDAKVTSGVYTGEYFVDGQNPSTQKPAIGAFHPDLNTYVILSGLTTDSFMDSYYFNINGTNVSNGCYYMYFPNTATLSPCYTLTGTKSTLVARAEALQEHNEALKMAEATGLQKALPVTPEEQAVIDNIQDMLSELK